LYLNRDGVGISKVEQEVISNDIGTINRITIKLTNGNVHSFDIKNGQTAYELAVAKGYKGTEEEWLDNLGYDSWLKGMVVTEEIYNSLPDKEKNKPGFMYVIKDAEIHVDSADEAKTLKPEKVVSSNMSNISNGFGVTLTDGVYLIYARYHDTNDYCTTGIISLNWGEAYYNKHCQSNQFILKSNTMYYCEIMRAGTTNNYKFFGKKRLTTNGQDSVENIDTYLIIYRIG
jgi:hypothetical protein